MGAKWGDELSQMSHKRQRIRNAVRLRGPIIAPVSIVRSERKQTTDHGRTPTHSQHFSQPIQMHVLHVLVTRKYVNTNTFTAT